MKVDAHQHFWKFDPVRDAWIDDSMSELRRDFLPADLLPHLQRNELDAVVAVQADQSLAETNFLLDAASEYDFIQGVVGWADLKDPFLQDTLDRYHNQSILKGFRHILQSEKDSFLLDPNFIAGLQHIGKENYTYDILVFEHQLPTIQELLKVLPNQKLVIDHLAKPRIKSKELEPWASKIKAIAKHENVYCKLSGMVTEADWRQWQPNDFRPYLDNVLEAFGPDRCMYGSDWPVCNLAADYDDVLSIVKSYIEQLTQSEQTKIMGETATAFYDL